MSKTARLVSILLALVLGISACNLPSNATPTPTQGADAVLTAAAQTVEANLTQAAILNPPTVPVIPTSTAGSPTVTLAVSTNAQPVATNTQICDLALFIKDVNIPDGTEFEPNEDFTKTWRLKNIGTCTWSGYSLVFDSGDAMGGPASTPIGSVSPGQEVDLSANLKSPGSDGSYTGYWRIKNSAGVLIPVSSGYQSKSFFVDIKVKSPAPTATNTVAPKADLIINLLELSSINSNTGRSLLQSKSKYTTRGMQLQGLSKWPGGRGGKLSKSQLMEWDIPSWLQTAALC